MIQVRAVNGPDGTDGRTLTPRRAVIRMACLLLWGGIFLIALAAPRAILEAQAVASLAGTVLEDRTNRPLPGSRVQLTEHGLDAVTDQAGSFSFSGIPVGQVTVRVSLDGYVTVVDRLNVARRELLGLVKFRLMPLVVALEELIVFGESDSRRVGHSETSLPRDDATSRSAADLLVARIPGLNLRRSQNTSSDRAGVRLTFRGLSSLVLTSEPDIYVDGVRVSSRSRDGIGPHILEQIPASSVASIRVLKGATAAAYYPNSSNGVILVETWRGSN
jgi:hypothetical protein